MGANRSERADHGFPTSGSTRISNGTPAAHFGDQRGRTRGAVGVQAQRDGAGGRGPEAEAGGVVARLRGAAIHDPLLGEAVAAQARRVEAYREVARVKASCAVFNRALRVVRDFPTRTPQEIVRADYRVSPRARRIERHVSNQLKRIDRRSGIGHRDADTLADAAQRMVALGGSAGYATAFQYALSLR